jgi:hypothetical protein
MSLRTLDVDVSEHRGQARLSVIQRRAASSVQYATYHLGDFASPLDLFAKWNLVRGSHSLWLALPGESLEWRSGRVRKILRRILAAVRADGPFQGKHRAHPLRIGAHTEQILLQIPVRLAHFGWATRSDDMAPIYFDRTLKKSPSSHWLFGAVSSLAAPSPDSAAS